MTNVNKSNFENIKVIVPTEPLLFAFEEIVSPNFTIIEKLLRQNQLLKESRDILLPRLITGMIDVNSFHLLDNVEGAINLKASVNAA